MIDVRVNGYSLVQLLAAPPVLKDELNSVCRSLDLTVQHADDLLVYMGQPIELWYNDKRWYYGYLKHRKVDDKGSWTYTAYDPLFSLKNEDDYYFKSMTATQAFKELATRNAIPQGKIANTGAVLPPLFYPGTEAAKIAVDVLARTYQANGKNYWYRFNSSEDDATFGLEVFQKVVPAEVWAFQTGVNMTAAEKDESIEEIVTIVKLVNRETGKIVTRADTTATKQYGPGVHFEEIDKDEAKNMDSKATKILKDKCKIAVTMKVEGINAYKAMPQFFSGDVIYAEEKYTTLLGAYHIINVTHTFESDDLIALSMDIEKTASIPSIEVDDATKNAKEKQAKDATKKGVQENQKHNKATDELIKKYGL